MRLHLRLDAVSNTHITESVFVDGALAGTLCFRHGEYQLFGAALLMGANQTHGDLVVEMDPITFDEKGNFKIGPVGGE